MSISLNAIVSLNTQGFTGPLAALQNVTANITGALMASFGGVGTEILAMGKAFGPIGAAVATLKQVSIAGMGVQESIANLRAETGYTGETIKALTDQAMVMSTKMTAGTGEIIAAMTGLHASGAETAEAIQAALVPALQLANISGKSVGETTENLVKTMNNFGLEMADATKVVNIFASSEAPEHMDRFEEAMLKASQTAQGYGITLNETAAMLSLFGDAGIEGTKAGQAFAMVMDKLSDSAKTMKGAIGEALAGWNPAVEGMAGALDRLKSAGVTTQEVLDTFGPRVGGAMVKMLNEGGPALRELSKNLENNKTMAEQYETKNNTLGASMKTLKNTIENLNVAAFMPMADALKGMVLQIQDVVQWIIKMTKALIAGDWATAKTMISDVFDSALAGVKSFGEALMNNIALPQTFAAIRNALDTLSVYFDSAKNTALGLFDRLRNTDWAAVLGKSLKLIDTALAAIIDTISGTIKVVQAMAQAWRDLDVGVKVALLVITGTAGIIIGLVKLITTVEAVIKATTALGIAMQASLISHAETAYIKFLLMGDAIKAVTLAQVGMVAGAAALGAGLGLLIRQIPGVADALDRLTISAGQFLGLVERQDPALKANGERLAKLRQEKSDLILAEEKGLRATDAATVAAWAQAEALNEQEDAAAEARNRLIEAAQAAGQVGTASTTNAAFLDALTGKQQENTRATLDQIVAMRGFAPASSLLADGTKDISKGVKAATQDTDNLKLSLKDLVGMLTQFKSSKISVFDISDFIAALKQMQEGLKDFKMPDIKLPDFSKLEIPRINALETSSFIASMQKLAEGLKNVNFGDLNLPDFDKIKIPNLSSHTIDNFLAGLKKLHTGMMNIDFGELGKIDINIKGDGSGAGDKLGEILKLLQGAKGIVWA